MNERIIALDVGDRRIGVAVSDPLGITAQPVETYTRVGYGPDVRHMAQLAAAYETNRFVCGLPRNMDGTEGFQVEKVRQFAQQLENAGFLIDFYDERMTTVQAEGVLLEANMHRDHRKQKIDMVAAVMILQSYLDSSAQMDADAQYEDQDDAQADETQETDGILEMEDEEGHIVRFYPGAQIEYAGKTYMLLSSAQSSEDMQEGESLIMQLTTDAEGTVCYRSIDDEALIEAVYEAYLAQSEAQD